MNEAGVVLHPSVLHSELKVVKRTAQIFIRAKSVVDYRGEP